MSRIKFQEPFRPVLLNLTIKTIDALDARADLLCWTRSDVMRQLLDKGLYEMHAQKPERQRWDSGCF